ncbi:hypothetical protein ABVN58_11825 [Fusobacterium polymorphum]|jgi:hypothetical protein|uniref:J domain-containing protein n=1 Tax=Fusobacterium nucleatum CTI-6 TaxID=1316587 RepID=U7TQY8_FUSNU|nr:hypothetical protein [Fusobacterium nucleatum]ERT45826.1 hypothetical protein HMPREF1767_02254 [Fusobacterium nucleatum CTI-6]
MKIIEKLRNISTIEELKKIGSVENIVKEIENVIKPLSIRKEKKIEYKELFEIVKLLKDKWKDFENDDYFKNERSKYLFCLTEVDGEKRNKYIGLTDNLYHDPKLAKKWYYKISKILNPNANPTNKVTAEAFNNLKKLYDVVNSGFEEDDSDE